MNMEHMKYLEAIARADVERVTLKESTYMGSWKKRGGAGAFFVTARKWDRLEVLLARANYDIFAALGRESNSGEDGTVLAEIRDLRSYLMLIEAEMMAAADSHIEKIGSPADGGHHARYQEG